MFTSEEKGMIGKYGFTLFLRKKFWQSLITFITIVQALACFQIMDL